MFPQVPQPSLGILRVPQLPPPLEQPKNPTTDYKRIILPGYIGIIISHYMDPTSIMECQPRVLNVAPLEKSWNRMDWRKGGFSHDWNTDPQVTNI